MSESSAGRHVVVLSRASFSVEELATEYQQVIVGPFRTRGRAERRAKTIRNLALTYEDPEGVTGPENALDVTVEKIRRGALSARHVLDAMYGGFD